MKNRKFSSVVFLYFSVVRSPSLLRRLRKTVPKAKERKKTEKKKESHKRKNSVTTVIRCIFIMFILISAGTEAVKHLPEIFKVQISYLQPHLYVYSVNKQMSAYNYTHIITKLLHTVCFTTYILVK